MDFNKFVEGLRALGIPNEYAVFLAYAVEAGKNSGEFKTGAGTFGQEQLDKAIQFVGLKGWLITDVNGGRNGPAWLKSAASMPRAGPEWGRHAV